MNTWRILEGDVRACLADLPSDSVNCAVTSVPYWGLRDYGVAGQRGLEQTPEQWAADLVADFRELRRVLRPDGVLWLNCGDSYASKSGGGGGGFLGAINESMSAEYHFRRGLAPGYKAKDLIGQAWMLAFALRADGWWLRCDVIWSKPNPTPEPARSRPMRNHEYIFLLTRSADYWYDDDAVREPHADPDRSDSPMGDTRRLDNDARNDRMASGGLKSGRSKTFRAMDRRTSGAAGHVTPRKRTYNPLGRPRRSVWEVASQPLGDDHFAAYPERLVEPCILAGCPEGGVVLDPFSGSGTTGVVSLKRNRSYIGIEINPKYVAMSRRRLAVAAPLFSQEVAAAQS